MVLEKRNELRPAMKKNSSESLFIKTLLSLYIIISIVLVLSIAVMHQTFPDYLYELHQRVLTLNLAFLLIIIAVIYLTKTKINGLRQSLISKALFILLLYVASFKAITLFSNEYLVNPFDTTGLRGFTEDLIMSGRIPQRGFFVEYAGAYNTLPLGPILTSITYIVMSSSNIEVYKSNILDNFLKFTEIVIAFYCMLLVYVFAKRFCTIFKELGTHRNYVLQVIILALVALLSLNPVLTLQTYAWPYLMLLHFIFFSYIMYEKFKLPSTIVIFAITLIALLEAHSATNLLNAIFFGLLLTLSSLERVHKTTSYTERVTIIAIVTLTGFFVKFFYDAIRYGKTFLDIGLDLIRSLLQLEAKTSTQLQSLESISVHLSIADYIGLYLVRLHGVVVIYFIIMLMIIYSIISILINRGTPKNRHNGLTLLVLSYIGFASINLLFTIAVLLSGGSLYTATGHTGILIIITLPLLSLLLSKILSKKALFLILLISLALGLLFSGNWLIMPKINDQPLISYTVNTPYKVKVAEFLKELLPSCSRESSSISSDVVTGWQIMGYAPSLYECFIWKNPIIEENVKSKYIVLPISVKAGYLNEPLTYRLVAFQKIRSLYTLINSLVYNNGGVVILVKSW